MGSYTARRGPRTGALLWRVEAEPGDLRILPDGVMDLMWSEGRFLFAGADTTAMISSSETGGVTWGLRLPPGAAHVLMGIPAHELTDQRFDLSELITVPNMVTESAHADPAAALERLLVTRWEKAAPEASALRLAESLDKTARAGLSVTDMAYRHGLSERTLRRVSDKLFGYGPKTLTAIHRFQYALHLARSGTPLAEAATMAGYVDQSHLNRDAQRLAGTTPGALAA
ncbi:MULTISPECIES: helix-turn-helix domain-containing protein [Micrococcales]|uniref:AraC family transcriptional regulator n=1 Tax=Sediminivirga luteola TaxID=1774748 RepID=A0A8J2XKM2_9MICO|nr:helix-turn-helix domain-containing protein [Sediminivirga luteola]MAY51488.1 AraC family transcriptional regulator [Microbacterium sp.]GGA15651.1 AraC family transcriptional regulator [Sediminivirga luteola]HAS33441.1 AraC family transcriptional regulator [Microbacterium sp.]HBR89574.1 AraC family transcriptional regulator [Microbacterium sp.]|tara:strand:+ start:36 stop:719 length:684 start_codon:yes stop_codon:yes gene_type:complete